MHSVILQIWEKEKLPETQNTYLPNIQKKETEEEFKTTGGLFY